MTAGAMTVSVDKINTVCGVYRMGYFYTSFVVQLLQYFVDDAFCNSFPPVPDCSPPALESAKHTLDLVKPLICFCTITTLCTSVQTHHFSSYVMQLLYC